MLRNGKQFIGISREANPGMQVESKMVATSILKPRQVWLLLLLLLAPIAIMLMIFNVTLATAALLLDVIGVLSIPDLTKQI